MTFEGKTAFISGASRGIGKAIALQLARHGANIVVTGKTDKPHPKLEGTIHHTVEEIDQAGGRGLAVVMDVREEQAVQSAVNQAVEKFGGIDILINNASAIMLTDSLNTPMRKYDLMQQVNERGTFLCAQKCIPHLLQSENPHILSLAPPIKLAQHWFGSFLPYTLAKYGMSLVTYGLAAEFKSKGLAVNALWPKTTIATAAIRYAVGGEEMMKKSRTVDIMADAAYHILKRDSKQCNSNFFIDEDVLREEGVTDFSAYAVDPTQELQPDLFL